MDITKNGVVYPAESIQGKTAYEIPKAARFLTPLRATKTTSVRAS